MEEFTCRNFSWVFLSSLDFPGGSDSKESACNVGRPEFDPWVGKIPWRRKWQPTLVFLPGKSHGQRSLAGNDLGAKPRKNEVAGPKRERPSAVDVSGGESKVPCCKEECCIRTADTYKL